MDALKERKCVPCEGGVRPLDAKQAGGMSVGLGIELGLDDLQR